MVALTEKQAYAAMVLFLDRYCRNTRSSETGALVSGMHFVTDGDSFETFDPAYWHEWLEDVQTVLDASNTPEEWARFEDEYLAYKVTAPDGNVLRARLDLDHDQRSLDKRASGKQKKGA